MPPISEKDIFDFLATRRIQRHMIMDAVLQNHSDPDPNSWYTLLSKYMQTLIDEGLRDWQKVVWFGGIDPQRAYNRPCLKESYDMFFYRNSCQDSPKGSLQNWCLNAPGNFHKAQVEDRTYHMTILAGRVGIFMSDSCCNASFVLDESATHARGGFNEVEGTVTEINALFRKSMSDWTLGKLVFIS